MVDNAAHQEQFGIPDQIALEFRQRNPMENPLIIDHVFSFLTIDAIKQCRLVCKKWNDISIGYMEKMATPVLRYLPRIAEIEEWYSESVNTFPDMPTFTFRAFKIAHSNCREFLSTVTRFLEGQNLHIRELIFDHIGYVVIPECYSIDSIIGDNLTKLAIKFSDLAVSVGKLTSTKFLNFENCRINVTANCNIAPKSLKMKKVVVVRDNSALRNLVVNEILSFEHLKHLNLHNNERYCVTSTSNYRYNTSLSINVAGNATIETLKLYNVEMESLEESNWKITGKVELISTPFEKNNQMEFAELDFKDSLLNLNVLPKSIRRLSLQFGVYLYNRTQVVTSPMPKSHKCHQLPQLEYLFLKIHSGGDDNDFQMFRPLALFAYCQNLTTVTLVNDSPEFVSENQILNTKWIPQSVKTLTISGPIGVEGSPINVDTLVVQSFKLDYYLANLRKLKSNNLILDLSLSRKYIRLISEMDEIVFTAIRMPYNSVTLGPYDASMYPNYVDQERSSYYVFKNEYGNAIEKEEFNNILQTAMSGIQSEG